MGANSRPAQPGHSAEVSLEWASVPE